MKIQAPIEVEVKISITDGQLVGVATVGVGCGRGNYPSEADIRAAVANFEKEQMPEGFRLLTKREWWDSVCTEEFGGRFAMPGGDDYDA